MQEMKSNNYIELKLLVDTMLKRIFGIENVLFTDKSIFHINGHVNKHICRYWSMGTLRLEFEGYNCRMQQDESTWHT